MKNLLCLTLLLALACTGHKKSQNPPPADSLKVVLNIKAHLGEGAIWNPIDNRLWWVDIEKGILHIFILMMERIRNIRWAEESGQSYHRIR